MESSAVAFIATGSELVDGTVINTNTAWMAEKVSSQGIEVREHRLVTDSQADMTTAIAELVKRYRIVVVSGGLGPTSDDRTRFALADVLGEELVFSETAWERIAARMGRLNLAIPESNRQQALFPSHAKQLDNPNGTAMGCAVEHEGSTIYLLPGPPNECRAMFEVDVLPIIESLLPPKWQFKRSWFLMGVSESDIAQVCDAIDLQASAEIAYRVAYPYLELKCFATESSFGAKIAEQIDALVGEHSIGDRAASDQLQQYLIDRPCSVYLDDSATGGRLLARLMTPETYTLFQKDAAAADWVIRISGFQSYWLTQTVDHHAMKLSWFKKGDNATGEVLGKIPVRGNRSLNFALEWCCLTWLRRIQSQ